MWNTAYNEAFSAPREPGEPLPHIDASPRIVIELELASRYGEIIDPPIEQAARGPKFAHGLKTGTE